MPRPLTRGRPATSRRSSRLELNEDGLGRRKAAIAESLRQRGATAGRKAGVADLLMQMPLFSHLWFLWFLWWLVARICGRLRPWRAACRRSACPDGWSSHPPATSGWSP